MGQEDPSDFDANRNVGDPALRCRSDSPKKEPPPAHWIELKLADEEGHPCPKVKYRVEGPDGEVKEGSLNEVGFARVLLTKSGTCKVTFPEMDTDAWVRQEK